LIEILIALVILSIALVSLAGLMIQSTRGNAYGGHMTEAATFAQDKLEFFRSTLWANVTNAGSPDQRTGATGINYTRTWNVFPNPVSANDTVREIQITIGWNDASSNQSHSVTFRSVIFRPF
jgi:Tfp pilus assembly protein PilV